MLRKFKDYAFLILAILFLIVPACSYFIYPTPQNKRNEESKIKQAHEMHLSALNKASDTARRQKSSGRPYSGNEERRMQAEREELNVQEKIVFANNAYQRQISELNKFPWTDAFVIWGLALTSLGIYFMKPFK